MVILHLRIAGVQKPFGICSAAISHHRFDEPEFPYHKKGESKVSIHLGTTIILLPELSLLWYYLPYKAPGVRSREISLPKFWP